MDFKQANEHIQCRVNSCEYHCGEKNCCSLSSIQVEPCKDCHTGKACDESMCGSYKCR